MHYRNWSDKSELLCLQAFKKLQQQGFPRGKQALLCAELAEKLAKTTKLTTGSLSAKICNYKSVAGINNPSNASENTRKLYAQYSHLSPEELQREIDKLP